MGGRELNSNVDRSNFPSAVDVAADVLVVVAGFIVVDVDVDVVVVVVASFGKGIVGIGGKHMASDCRSKSLLSWTLEIVASRSSETLF